MDSEVICNPKKKHTLTHSLNNIGLRDASASKNKEEKTLENKRLAHPEDLECTRIHAGIFYQY